MKTRLPAALCIALAGGLPIPGARILIDTRGAEGAPAAEPVAVEARLLSRNDSLTVELSLNMGKNIRIYSAASRFFIVKVVRREGLGAPSFDLPRPSLPGSLDGTPAECYVDGQTIAVRLPVEAPRWTLDGFIRFQACDESKCFLPQKKRFVFSSDAPPAGPLTLGDFTDDDGAVPDEKRDPGWKATAGGFRVEGKTGGYMNSGAFLSFLENPSAHGGKSGFAGRNIWLVLLLVVLGGLALNLTPCVLPMIPITIAVLGGGAQAGSRTRGFLLGTVYGLAMAFTYGMLGIVVVLTGTQFGAINASPAFNLIIAALFAVLALAMFDVIHIDFTRMRGGLRPDDKKRGTLVTAFVMGIVAALLAGACVAPAVISTVLYAAALYSGGVKAGILLPLLLGLGMALPWPLAGTGLSFLPKPGRWMVVVRNSFGAIILAIAVFYGYSGVHILIERAAPRTSDAPARSAGLPWHHSLEQGLRQAASEDRPVFIDFWATWCKNCLAMDATTFRDPAVRKKLSEFVLVKYRAENPREPAVKEVLDRFGVVGLPTYVVLRTREQREEPIP